MSVERLPLSSVETSDNGVTKREPLLSFRPFHPSDKLAVGFETLSVGRACWLILECSLHLLALWFGDNQLPWGFAQTVNTGSTL